MIKQRARGGRIRHRISAWPRAAALALLCMAWLAALPAGADTSAPIKLAVFEFELEDFSAAAASTVDADAAHLATVTREIRELLAETGRYELIDVGAAEAAAVTSHTLRDCNGCEAAIAQELGAEQSFLGVVRRISRTEYLVRYQIRDARTGEVVSAGDSGLRMGADYSWNRGAARLVKDRLLASEAQQ